MLNSRESIYVEDDQHKITITPIYEYIDLNGETGENIHYLSGDSIIEIDDNFHGVEVVNYDFEIELFYVISDNYLAELMGISELLVGNNI